MKKEKALQLGIMLISAVLLLTAVFAQPSPTRNADDDIQEYLGMLNFLFRYVKDHYVEEVSPSDLYEGAIRGIFESLNDPHSSFLTAKDMDRMRNTTVGQFGGVGLYIAKDDPDGNTPDNEDYQPYVRVVAPIEGSPAFRAGVHTGDYITKIEGESTVDMTIDEVVDRLKGPPNTRVNVTIMRSKTIVFDVEITRAIIELPTVKRDMIGSIAYLRIIDWTPYTANRIREAVQWFEEQNYTSMIVDVRSNPGGLLESVVESADLFLPEGIIVQTKSRIQGESTVHRASNRIAVPARIPVIVLINNGSASASEIFAGAMQDSRRATLMGETSFGKGSVQWVRAFGDTGFKLTIAHYHTPNGRRVERKGIDPDIGVEAESLSEEDLEDLQNIFKNRLIRRFVDENPEEEAETVTAFIDTLRVDGINIDTNRLRLLIRDEYNRRLDFPPVFDLEFDTVLQKAVELIQSGDVPL